MQRTTNTKLISGLSASGSTTTITAGSGINVSKGTVSIDGTVVATDTELSTQLASKASSLSVSTNTTAITTNTTAITTNTTNIATNTFNTSENAYSITQNIGNITGLGHAISSLITKTHGNEGSIATNTSNIATLTPFSQTWTYDTRVFLGLVNGVETDDLMWDDNQAVWLDSSTSTNVILPSGIYTCKITTNGGNSNGNKGASENLRLWVFTGSFTYIKGPFTNDFDKSPEIVESIAQWWHKNELSTEVGSRAEIVRKPNSYMQTYFRWRGIPEGNGSFINLRFQMKRLW
jgi:hypothetical protein